MSRRRPRRSAPAPGQIWRLFDRTAREVRLARLEHAALLRRLAQEEAARARRLAQQEEEAHEEIARRREEAHEEIARRREEAREEIARWREEEEKKRQTETRKREQEEEKRYQEARKREQEEEKRYREARKREQEEEKRYQEARKREQEEEKRYREARKREQEEEKRYQEARKREQEEEKRYREARRREQEEEKRYREAEKRRQEAHLKNLAAIEAETVKVRKEREEIEARLEKKLDRMAGYHDNRWGRLLEALVEGGLAKILRQAGIPIVDVAPRVRSSRDGEWREWDLVAYGESDVVVVEVKTTLTRPDIPKFVKGLGEFRLWRRDYAYGSLRGGLAYLTTDPETARQVERAGLYRIRAVGESARLDNSEGFEPRLF